MKFGLSLTTIAAILLCANSFASSTDALLGRLPDSSAKFKTYGTPGARASNIKNIIADMHRAEAHASGNIISNLRSPSSGIDAGKMDIKQLETDLADFDAKLSKADTEDAYLTLKRQKAEALDAFMKQDEGIRYYQGTYFRPNAAGGDGANTPTQAVNNKIVLAANTNPAALAGGLKPNGLTPIPGRPLGLGNHAVKGTQGAPKPGDNRQVDPGQQALQSVDVKTEFEAIKTPDMDAKTRQAKFDEMGPATKAEAARVASEVAKLINGEVDGIKLTDAQKQELQGILEGYLRDGADFNDYQSLMKLIDYAKKGGAKGFDSLGGLANLVLVEKRARSFLDANDKTEVIVGYDENGKPMIKKWNEITSEADKQMVLAHINSNWIASGKEGRGKLMDAIKNGNDAFVNRFFKKLAKQEINKEDPLLKEFCSMKAKGDECGINGGVACAV